MFRPRESFKGYDRNEEEESSTRQTIMNLPQIVQEDIREILPYAYMRNIFFGIKRFSDEEKTLLRASLEKHFHRMFASQMNCSIISMICRVYTIRDCTRAHYRMTMGIFLVYLELQGMVTGFKEKDYLEDVRISDSSMLPYYVGIEERIKGTMIINLSSIREGGELGSDNEDEVITLGIVSTRPLENCVALEIDSPKQQLIELIGESVVNRRKVEQEDRDSIEKELMVEPQIIEIENEDFVKFKIPLCTADTVRQALRKNVRDDRFRLQLESRLLQQYFPLVGVRKVVTHKTQECDVESNESLRERRERISVINKKELWDRRNNDDKNKKEIQHNPIDEIIKTDKGVRKRDIVETRNIEYVKRPRVEEKKKEKRLQRLGDNDALLLRKLELIQATPKQVIVERDIRRRRSIEDVRVVREREFDIMPNVKSVLEVPVVVGQVRHLRSYFFKSMTIDIESELEECVVRLFTKKDNHVKTEWQLYYERKILFKRDKVTLEILNSRVEPEEIDINGYLIRQVEFRAEVLSVRAATFKVCVNAEFKLLGWTYEGY